MKKVGILTFHYADNYGAVLQAWALQKKINSFVGYSAEIINYIPGFWGYTPYENNEESRIKMIEKRRLFNNFLCDECGVICENVVLSVTGNLYDYYCVGSDQVWNMDIDVVRQMEYFLPNISADAYRFSYAASIGMSRETLKNYSTVFEKYIGKFRYLSLREQEQIAFVEEKSQKKCELVLDPTLLITADEYKRLIEKKQTDEPFVFLFWLGATNWDYMKGIEFANIISRKYKLPVVHNIINSQPHMLNKDGGCMYYEGIDSFLWYIKNADIVVTNSYHVLCLSIQFKTPFYVLVKETAKSRIDTLSEILGIGKRVVQHYIDACEMNKTVDFDHVEDRLLTEREKSIAFLKKALEII